MSTKRDVWAEQTEALIAALRERKAAIAGDAHEMKAEFERRYELLKAEHSALKTEIEVLEDALGIHRARLTLLGQAALPAPAAEPKQRALPTPGQASSGRVQPNDPEHPANLIKAWVREHGGLLVIREFVTHLVDRGRYSSQASAEASISPALAKIGKGFEKVGKGQYRFYAIDGVALQASEE